MTWRWCCMRNTAAETIQPLLRASCRLQARNVSDWKDERQVAAYLKNVLYKNAFYREGLIYGMGHAVYSLSDPRADIFKRFVEALSKYKGVSANIDFYSGFVYSMLDLPLELYTPIFANARIAQVVLTKQ